MEYLVVDIDNTIADTRRRVKASLDRVGRVEVYPKAAESYGGFDKYLTPDEEERFWQLFLSDKFLHLDEPAEGSAQVLRDIRGNGVELFYLTGRHDETGDSMRPGTETWLKENGFPAPDQNGVSLCMKFRRKMEDEEFKRELLGNEFGERPAPGEAVGVGDNPDDAVVYSEAGIRPILINWLELFPME